MGDLQQDKEFLDLTSKASPVKGKIEGLDFIKIERLCPVKGPLKRMKDKPQTERKYLQIAI